MTRDPPWEKAEQSREGSSAGQVPRSRFTTPVALSGPPVSVVGRLPRGGGQTSQGEHQALGRWPGPVCPLLCRDRMTCPAQTV